MDWLCGAVWRDVVVKALNFADETYIRLNTEGMMNVQHQVIGDINNERKSYLYVSLSEYCVW